MSFVVLFCVFLDENSIVAEGFWLKQILACQNETRIRYCVDMLAWMIVATPFGYSSNYNCIRPTLITNRLKKILKKLTTKIDKNP